MESSNNAKKLKESEAMEEGIKSSWIKIIISILFLLLSLNIIMLKLNPLPGYVYSFYEHVPVYFWIISVIIFFSASILLIEFRFLPMKYRYLSFFLVLLNNAVILFSPYICGAYTMSGGDLPMHVGKILDIVQSGKINFNINYYPFTHVLAFSISAFSNISYMDSVKILSPIFSLLLPFYSYILAKEITDNRFVQTLSFLISSTFYLSSITHPNSITAPMVLSMMMLPLLFFLFIKNTHNQNNTMSFVVCLLLSFSAYVFFHPLTSFVLIFSFGVLYVLGKFMKTQVDNNGSLFFLIAAFSFNFNLTQIWVRPLKNMLYYFILGFKIPLGYWVDIQGELNKLSLTRVTLLLLFIKSFGHQGLLLLFSFSSIILILFGRMRKYSKYYLLPIFAFTLASGMLLLVQIFIPITMNISFWRFLTYMMVFTPILSSLFLSTIRKRSIVITILMFLFINSLLVLYTSPYANQPNTQITYRDLSSSKWLIDHKKADVGLSGYSGYGITIGQIGGLLPFNQFYDELYHTWYDDKSIMPDHLGYDKNNYIIDTFQEERYLIINRYDIVVYTEVYRNLERLSFKDIDKVYNDNTALHIYDSEDNVIFYIQR